jgi:RND family efflux transporter MFP subunit
MGKSSHLLSCALLIQLFLPSSGIASPPTRVVTVPLETVLETPRYDAPATVVARDAPSVAAEVSATVVEVPVIIGDQVEPGDLLVRLDCARFEVQRDIARAALARAAAQRRFARRQLQRTQDLRRKNSISEELLDQRETELAASETDVDSAEAALRQSEIDTRSCEVRAPLAGVVVERHVSVGDYTTPGSPVADLVAVAGLEVSVRLRADQIATFTTAPSWSFVANGQVWPLRLRTVVPVLDALSRTREARLTFEDRAAIPGTPGRINWSGDTPLIPAGYIVRRKDALGVFVLAGQEARFIPLPDAQEGRPAPTTLPATTRLISEGRQRLNDGEAVLESDPGAAAE